MPYRPKDAPEHHHGVRARYNANQTSVRCRCDVCRAANSAYQREYRKAKRAGSQLRLELPMSADRS